MIWTIGASSTGADTGPPGRSPSRGGATLDYPVHFASPDHGDLGDGEKILNTTSARPELSGAGFFMPSSRPAQAAMSPILPAHVPPLVWPPTACGRHFCARVQQGGAYPKTQNRRKGHLQARHGVLYPCGYPYIPTPSNGLQRPADSQTGHKATPARSVME